MEAQREERKRLPVPRTGGSVWPKEFCPAFSPREGWLPIEKEQCWYCRYANFHLTAPVALDVGICYYPQAQMEQAAGPYPGRREL